MPKVITPKTIKKIFKLKKDGLSLREISRVVKLSVNTVRSYLNDLKLKQAKTSK